MSADALPLTLLIIFAEFTIGGLWVLWLADLRGTAAASFVKFGAALVFATAALPFWIAAKVSVTGEVDGYPLDPSYMPPARIALALVFALALPYALLTLRGARRPGLAAGGFASAAGLAGPFALSYMAFDSSGVRAMQSATGLLYIAMALVLSGEVLAKGLLFATAGPP